MNSLRNVPMKRMIFVWAGVLLVALVVLVIGIMGAPARTSNSSNTAVTQPTVTANVADNPAEPTLPVPTATELPTGPHVGYIAPDITLSDLDAHRISLASLKGKPVWLNFWATWCGDCHVEMPAIKEKYNAFKDKRLNVWGINIKEDPTTIHNYIDPNGYNWTFMLDWEGFGNTAAQTYQVQALPVSVFIDKDGIIKAINIGQMSGLEMSYSLEKIGLK